MDISNTNAYIVLVFFISLEVILFRCSSELILVFCTPVLFLTLDIKESSQIMSDTQQVDTFSNNKVTFEKAVLLLKKYPYITNIDLKNNHPSTPSRGVYGYITKNGFYIESNEELSNNIINELDQSCIKDIFKNLKFKSIGVSDQDIDFTQGSSMSEAKGLIYIKDINDFKVKTYEIKQIDGNWYTYVYQ